MPGALTEGRCSVAPPDGECVVLRAPRCEVTAGKWCRRALCNGLFSQRPAGRGDTSCAERYDKRERYRSTRVVLRSGWIYARWRVSHRSAERSSGADATTVRVTSMILLIAAALTLKQKED